MKQKIGLARAFYGSPNFIVLDEPTSKLDSQSEKKFLDAVRRLKDEGACIIIITHNSKIIRSSDNILMIGAGEQKLFDSKENVFSKIRATIENGQKNNN